MSAYLAHLLAGLGGGAVLAVLGTGLVLTFRSSGVLNFGYGAMALYLGSVFFELRETGDLVLPVLGLPARLPLVERPTVITASLATAALGAALGAAVHGLLVRPLRHADEVARIAGTLGLLLYLQELVRLRFPPSSAGATVRRPVLPEGSVEVLGATVGRSRLLLVVVAVALGAALTVVYDRTRFGLASRAAAENELGARVVGRSPAVYGAAAWSIAAVVAGAIAVLAEPVIGLGPTTPLLVVPALAAALPGGLRSIPLAVAGGLGIGVAQSLILGYVVTDGGWIPDWVPATGLQEAIPTLVVVGVLVVRRGRLETQGPAGTARTPAGDAPARGAAIVNRAPRHPLRWASLLAAAALVALFTASAPYRHALVVSMLFALICLSVVVATGWSGQVSLMPLAVAGVAGVAALGAATAGVPFPAAATLGVATAVLGGRLLSAPFARLRGVTLALATLAVAMVLERLVIEGAATALAGHEVPRPTILGVDVGFSATGDRNFRAAFGVLTLSVLVAACASVGALRRSRSGLAVVAAGGDELAALTSGVDARSARRSAFTLSCAIAGAAGVLTVFSVEAASARSFMVIGSIVAVSITAMAGAARIAGALFAGALAQSGLVTTVTERWIGPGAASATYAVIGLALMATVVLAPHGLLNAREARRSAAPATSVRPRPVRGSGALPAGKLT